MTVKTSAKIGVFVNVEVIPDCCQIFKVGLNTAIIATGAGFSGLIDVKIVGLRCAIQHGRCSFSVLNPGSGTWHLVRLKGAKFYRLRKILSDKKDFI